MYFYYSNLKCGIIMSGLRNSRHLMHARSINLLNIIIIQVVRKVDPLLSIKKKLIFWLFRFCLTFFMNVFCKSSTSFMDHHHKRFSPLLSFSV